MNCGILHIQPDGVSMSKCTWRQKMTDLFLRREQRKAQKAKASELQKKLSKDKANLKGLGEEE